MKTLEVRLQFSIDEVLQVGTLALHERRCYFEFDPAFLTSGLQISPFKLPAQSGLIEHREREFGPLPGVFDDSMPDGWGRLLMDRRFRQQGLDPASISPLQRLAWLGTRTMGALTYHPCGASDAPTPLQLRQVALEVDQVLKGNTATVLPELLRAGGSPGGARPKLLVGLQGDLLLSGEDELPNGYTHWLVKIPTVSDGRDAGRVEFAYAHMAGAAGVDMPPVRLLPAGPRIDCFAIQRFDRAAGQRRLHMHSLANLLHADFRTPSLDYTDLLRVTQLLTRNQHDVARAYRRMLFNVAAHNRDDHGKNFAFLMTPAGEWSLSPAFDLCPSSGPGGEHSTSVMGEGRNPAREHCLALAGKAGLRAAQARTMIDEVNAAITRWTEFADAGRLTRKRSTEVGAKLRVL